MAHDAVFGYLPVEVQTENPMIETAPLNQLIFDAFTGKTTWLWASGRYPLAEFIDSFLRTRATMQRTLERLTDAQVAYQAPGIPTWSLSETITHLIYSQNGYYNQLLDVTGLQLPHLVEAARGYGEGARQNVPAQTLREGLQKATTFIEEGLEKTRGSYDPKLIVRNPLFGEATYVTWVLLMLAHETDHVRQAIVMRRLAKAALPG